MKREQGQVAKRYIISGRVQGVGYRFFAERHARELGVRGYVQNRSDGCVEVYAIGGATALEELKRREAAAEDPLRRGEKKVEVVELGLNRRLGTEPASRH